MADKALVLRRGEGHQTSSTYTEGMQREEFVSPEGSWAGMARTAPGVVSGWHHHGDNVTYAYVIKGGARFEGGLAGREVLEVKAGEGAYIPAHYVHRESNPGKEESLVFVVRAGSGPTVFNVDGPE